MPDRAPSALNSTIVACLDGPPRLLRPGGLSRALIEQALGAELADATNEKLVRAPGALESHYAPRAKLRLDALTFGPGELALDFGGRFPASKDVLDLSPDARISTRPRRGSSHSCANSTRVGQPASRSRQFRMAALARRSTTGWRAPPRRGPYPAATRTENLKIKDSLGSNWFTACPIASSNFCSGTPTWASTSRLTRRRMTGRANAQAHVAPEKGVERPEPVTAAPPAVLQNAVVSAAALEQSAREAAASARTLAELREGLLRFEGCGLKATATQLVFGSGEAAAEVMFVGEAPGADEDRQGAPFVGRAGQLLDKMLDSIGLDRGKVYIANVVPWRPPGNRTPSPLETAACLPFTRRQIELVGPKILVCLGAASAQTLLNTTEGILRLRGRWLRYDSGGATIKATAMLHPAYLLRQPAQKKLAWQDLRLLAKEIARLGAASSENSA